MKTRLHFYGIKYVTTVFAFYYLLDNMPRKHTISINSTHSSYHMWLRAEKTDGDRSSKRGLSVPLRYDTLKTKKEMRSKMCHGEIKSHEYWPIDEFLPVGAQGELDVEALLPRELGGHPFGFRRVVVTVLAAALPGASVLLVLQRVAHAHRPSAVHEHIHWPIDMWTPFTIRREPKTIATVFRSTISNNLWRALCYLNKTEKWGHDHILFFFKQFIACFNAHTI